MVEREFQRRGEAFGCEWRKRETEVIGLSSFASGFDIYKLAKVTALRFMKEIVGNGDYLN